MALDGKGSSILPAVHPAKNGLPYDTNDKVSFLEENMKKIPTLFERQFENHKIVKCLPRVTKGFEWVIYGEGIATIKWDGSACAIIDGELYKRFDAKKGKAIPKGAIKCQDEADPITGHFPCWLKCDINNPADKWFFAALSNTIPNDKKTLPDATYEAIGKHFNGNPYGYETDVLIKHGIHSIYVDRSYNAIKDYLRDTEVEGIVFWKDNMPQCKIKRTDFGFKWGDNEK